MSVQVGGWTPEPEDKEGSREAERSVGLRWTRHPLVDMGVATLVAISARERPEEVTPDDLNSCAGYVERALGTAAVQSHASVLFTINVPYLQPSFSEQRRAAKAKEILHAFELAPAGPSLSCVYCGRSAIRLDTESGRAYRELIPLLTGQGIINFAPYGQHGLPICGLCVTALQALVIGAPSCEGRALIVSADDPAQLVPLIRDWLPDLQRRIHLSEVSGAKVDTWKAPRSRLIERLVHLERGQRLAEAPTGFTLYHASNSGQGPTLDIHYLPAPIGQFVRLAQSAVYHLAWNHLSARAWRDGKRKAAEREPDTNERPFWRNMLYEDLFRLPETAPFFVHRYLFGSQRASLKVTPKDGPVALWDLTQLFLREVMGMDDERIRTIRALGDALADEIVGNNDRRLFRTVFQATRYPTVRQALLGVSARRLRRDEPPIVDFDDFLTVFEVGEDLPRENWRLAWDLVLIRLIDQLHTRGWIRQHADAAEDLADVEEQSLIEADGSAELIPTGARE